MGAIGYSMDGSGLDVLWQTVYAGATVQHMLNGHAYARALRAPLSDISRANNPSPIKPHCLDHVDTNQLRQKLSSLIDKDCDIHDIQVDLLIKNFVDVIERASVDVAAFRTGKFIGTSMQVVRARTSETTRRFYMWLSANSPFVYTCESVVCLSTGMVAGKIVNCDNAFEVGCIAASDMTNGNFSDVKLKRNDKVKNIASMTNTVTIPNKCVTINPAVLFSRITCILRDSSEMEGHGTTRVPSGKVGLNDYSYLKTQCKYCNNSIQVMKLELSIIIVKSKGPVTLIQDQWELGRTSRKGNILKFVPHSGWKLRLA
ncbi:hypothetical protein GQR58_005644 [Nymphon striatum]|nr:hypothetical protein GQR58_005644 [Nymphon striatum]